MNFKEPLPKEEQQLLFEEYIKTNDPMIREKLILHNLRLVMWLAKQYDRPGERELDDLFQSGVIGLMRALEDYDPNKGAFSGYATWWIKQAITRDIDNTGRVIRIPVHMAEKIKSLRNIQNELTKKLERDPTFLEISIKMGLEVEEVEELFKLSIDPTSLNLIIGGDSEDITLEDSLADSGPTPDVIVGDKVFIEQIKAEIKPRVTELQYDALIMYYGLEGQTYTLKEIAEKHNYKSGEYIRTERDKALRNIRPTKFFQEIKKEVDERTSFIKSIDYSQPSSKGGPRSSPVENLVLLRERIRNELKRDYNI